MRTKEDFFFGKAYQGSKGITLQLSDMESLAEKVSDNFFTAQLNRMLQEHGGRLTIADESSLPHFWGLIDKIDIEQVGFVEIYARYDVNDSVNATLACDIVLLNGVISIKTHWCAYKEIRAGEIISTLLVPLHLKALQNKTHIRWDNGTTEPLLRNDDYQTELENVFLLANYPSAINRDRSYKVDLESATDVGRRGFSSEQAWDAYHELRTERCAGNSL
ncbi:hypothetical protein [Shewanella oncorhynchi]|uniref:hypothetical protein n=1 Tax=Shewanella oncorhynchi TaxID=2726434 RepID=UPI00303ABA1F